MPASTVLQMGTEVPQSSAWSFPAELLFIPFTQEVVQGVLKETEHKEVP